MKRLVLWIMTLSLLMAACTAPHEGQQYLPELVAEGDFSEALYQALSDDWAAYDAMSEEEKMCSSHLPGWCSREFDEWEAVEQFVGLTIPNPLEELELLEKGTYVGMPLGFMNAPRFSVAWYGTREGHVEWVQINSGYRTGDIRVCLETALYSDSPESKSRERGWSVEHQRLNYLEEREGDKAVITTDGDSAYDTYMATLARGYALYTIHVIGEPGTREELYPVLEQLLPTFEEIPVS